MIFLLGCVLVLLGLLLWLDHRLIMSAGSQHLASITDTCHACKDVYVELDSCQDCYRKHCPKCLGTYKIISPGTRTKQPSQGGGVDSFVYDFVALYDKQMCKECYEMGSFDKKRGY